VLFSATTTGVDLTKPLPYADAQRHALQAGARVAVSFLLWLATRIEVRDAELARWMLHPAALASEQLLLVARKNQNA